MFHPLVHTVTEDRERAGKRLGSERERERLGPSERKREREGGEGKREREVERGRECLLCSKTRRGLVEVY